MSLFISPQASFHLSWLLKGVDAFLPISILYTFLEILGDFSKVAFYMCLILYMKIPISCNLLLNREVMFALPSRSYEADHSEHYSKASLSFRTF